MQKCLNRNVKRCSDDIERRRSFRQAWKRWLKLVILSKLYRKQEKLPRPSYGRRPKNRDS